MYFERSGQPISCTGYSNVTVT